MSTNRGLMTTGATNSPNRGADDDGDDGAPAVVLADRLRELTAGACSEADQATPIAVSSDLTVRLIDGDRSLIELLAYPDYPPERTVFNIDFDEARQLADRLYELAGGHAQQ